VRFYKGYAAINQQQPIGWRTYTRFNSREPSIPRRLAVRVQRHHQPLRQAERCLRLQHNADGTITVRADQSKADELLGDNHPQTHIMRAQFVWNLPRLSSADGAGARLAPSSTTGVCRASGPARRVRHTASPPRIRTAAAT
jgi:hypothetical protein